MTFVRGESSASHRSGLAELDRWIRTRFVELNTALEEQYAVLASRSSVDAGDELKGCFSLRAGMC